MIARVLRPTALGLRQISARSFSDNVLTKNINEVYVITINRPDKRNCVNSETSKQLLRAVEEFESDKTAKVAVLTGKGGNFCAGYDLEELSEMGKSGENICVTKGPMGPSVLATTKPMVAAIDGYAVGGGLELALLCDLRVCEENAVMGMFNRRFGVPLIDGGTVRLPKIVGLSRALDLILTGREIRPEEALSMGLVNKVTETGTALGVAISLAQSLTKFPQECLKADRRSVYYSTFEAKSVQDALQYEYENGIPIVEKEGVEGAQKFIKSGIGRHGKFQLHKLEEIFNRHKPKLV